MHLLCTEGAFTCTEVGDELQTVISGHITITRDDGESAGWDEVT